MFDVFEFDVFERARQEIDLLNFLTGYGFEFRRYSSSIRSDRCPACGPSDRRGSNKLSIRRRGDHYTWFCFACGEGGDVVTAAQHLEGFLRPIEAARWLLGETSTTVPPARTSRPELKKVSVSSFPTEVEAKKKNNARLILIKQLIDIAQEVPRTVTKQAWEYVVYKRGIPEQIVKQAIERKLFFLLPSPVVLNRLIVQKVEPEVLTEAEVLFEGKVGLFILKRPWLCPFYKKTGVIGAQFRAVSDIQPKAISMVRSGFWWWGGKEKTIAIVEGMPDLLSLIAMGWQGNILALPGVGLAKRAVFVLQKLSMPVYIGLDSDEAGQKAAQFLLENFPMVEGFIIPRHGKDLNDTLRAGCCDWKEIFQPLPSSQKKGFWEKVKKIFLGGKK